MTKEGAEKRDAILNLLSVDNAEFFSLAKTRTEIEKASNLTGLRLDVYLKLLQKAGHIEVDKPTEHHAAIRGAWAITAEGQIFIDEEGGYVGLLNAQTFENRRMTSMETRSTLLSAFVALGTVGLLIFELVKFYFEHHCFCH
jgi:hypothetical protein